MKTFLANQIWRYMTMRSWMGFKSALSTTEEIQKGILAGYLARNSNTDYGKKYEFGSIRSAREYVSRVPCVGYEELKPYINAAAEGKQNVLTSDPVILFEPTSGSTDAFKLIPFTRRLKAEFQRAINPWVFDLFRSYPALAKGRSYWSISPGMDLPKMTSGGIRIGFENDSSYLGLAGRLASLTMAVPPGVKNHSEMEEFQHMTLLHLLMARDLAFVSIWNPSFLLVMLDYMEKNWKKLLEDLESGIHVGSPGLAGQSIPVGMRSGNARNRVNILARLSPNDYRNIWPSLRLISCWKDGYAEQDATQLSKKLPWIDIQGKGLMATEAFVSIPFEGQTLLAVRSHFFEFQGENGDISLAHELIPGRKYSVIVTTGGGLYRYRMMDQIQVTGFRASVPAIRFLGKEDKISDMRGEKLSEGFVGQMLKEFSEKYDLAPRLAMLAPELKPVPHYVFFLECGKNIPAACSSWIEEYLKRNPYYRLCVEMKQLKASRIFLVSNGGQRLFLKRQLESGRNLGGIKPTPLSSTPGWAEVLEGHYLQ